MNRSPFTAPYEQLPDTLPIFPLPGAIVMPGSELPLNIFEPRYLNMVGDALGSHRMIGMIQPQPDSGDGNDLCRSGCAGRITQYRETDDGRIEMVLSGVCRYDRGEELPTTRGYRLIVPDWSRFRDDYADHEQALTSRRELLLITLKRYFKAKGLDVDWVMLERMSMLRLMNSLSMALPLGDQDKQMLLETVDAGERLQAFMALLGNELEPGQSATHH